MALSNYILTQDQKFLKPLLDRLQDEDPETRKLGVRALRPVKLSYAPEPLVKLLADSNPDIQADAARLLGMIGDPKTIPVLIEVATATDGDRHVRANAIRAIGSMRVKEAESVMRKLLSDESVEVAAAIALFQITGERHPLLPKRFNDDDVPGDKEPADAQDTADEGDAVIQVSYLWKTFTVVGAREVTDPARITNVHVGVA